MRRRDKRRLEALESFSGVQSKEEREEEERTQRELFYFVDLALKEHPEWNPLPRETKWRIFTNPLDDRERELNITGLRLLKTAIEVEKERRAREQKSVG